MWKNRKKLTYVFILIFVCLLSVIYVTGSNRQEKKELQEEQEKLSIVKEKKDSKQKKDSYNNLTTTLTEEFHSLQQENPDMVGWITIPGTKIDDPVMQRVEDENYYLYRDFYGNKNQKGSLILSNGCDVTSKISNWIIHGHNMSSGEMFGELEKYRVPEFREEHALIFLQVEAKVRTYLVMGAFESQVYYENDDVFKFYHCYEIRNKEEFDFFYQNIKELFLYDSEITAVYGDVFLLLSTCSYHTENGRFVVVAKQVYLE